MRRAALLLAAVGIAIAVIVLVVPHLADEPAPPGVDDRPGAADAVSGSGETANATRRPVAGQRRGAAIEGVVLDADAPAAGAAVECVLVGDEPPPRTGRPAVWLEVFSAAARSPAAAWRGTSDASGRFRSGPLAPGTWRVVARAADGRAAASTVPLAARPDARVEIRLPPRGFVVRGRVLGADGSPAAARVAVQPVTDRGFAPDEFPRLAWSDAAPDGAFVLAGISVRRVNVVAAAGTEVVSVGPVALPREEPLVVRFGEGVTRRRGLVRDAQSKAPVAGARISWIAWDHEEHRTVGTQATAGPDGRFEVPGLSQGRAYVEADGFATEHVWDHGGAAEIVVELARFEAIGGRVVAVADGRPVEGAIVRAIGRRPSGLDPVVSATSDASGAFRLEGASPGDAFVYVHGGGWTSPGLGTAKTDGPNAFFVGPGARGALVLAVEPSARAEGRVVDTAGAPVPGARVTTWSQAFGHERAGTALPQGAASFPAAVCDDRGRFVLADLIPGATYSVRAKADGWAEVDAEHVAGRPGELELRLLDSWFVDVRVVAEEDGHPIAGATVRAEARTADGQRGFDGDAVTDADGRARFGPGPRGELGLYVDAPDRIRREEAWWVGVTQKADTSFAEVRVPKGLSIGGRVEVPDDAPPARVTISVCEILSDTWVDEFQIDPPEFRADRLTPGPHSVAATLDAGDGRTWFGIARAEAGRADLVIPLTLQPAPPAPREHELAVRVLGADGVAVFAAELRAWCWRGIPSSLAPGTRMANGVATLRVGNDVDRVVVEVTRPRDRQERPLPWGAARVELTDSRATELVVRLPPAKAIEGRVVDTAGRGVAGARVGAGFVAGPSAPHGLPSDVALTWATSDGRFRLDGFGDGRYWVGTALPGGWRATSPVQAQAGATDVAIVVEPVTPVRVVVLDADGAPLAGALVSTPGRGGATGADGTFVVADAPPGDGGALIVQPPPSRADLLPLWLPKWNQQDTTVRLQPGAVVSGAVRDQHGRPIVGARVMCKGEGAQGTPDTRTDAAGRFLVGRLRPGARVEVWTAIGEDEFVRAAETSTGVTDLAVVVDLGICLRVRLANAERNEIEGPVRALLADGSERDGRFGPDGIALVRDLPPGAVLRLRFGPTYKHRWAAADGVVPAEDDLVLTLRDGATIVGRLEIPEESAGDVSGTAERDGFRVHVPVDGLGFVARGLPPGTWRLRFESRSRSGPKSEGTADVETGTLDAVVRLVRRP